ncbi:hypothetical protein R0K05_02080 [Planococcus sp. SIMBA_160]
MKQWSNFYFWASWTLLGCLIILVFYIYQENFEFRNIIDIKTVLTVLGTVYGAYFGAKIAGSYAVASVEKQIDFHNNSDLEKERKVLNKKLVEMHVYGKSAEIYTNDISKKLSLFEERMLVEKDPEFLTMLIKQLRKIVTSIENVDLSEVYDRPHLIITSIRIHLENIIVVLEVLEGYVLKGYGDLYTRDKEDLFSMVESFQITLNELQKEMDKVG